MITWPTEIEDPFRILYRFHGQEVIATFHGDTVGWAGCVVPKHEEIQIDYPMERIREAERIVAMLIHLGWKNARLKTINQEIQR